MVKLLVFITKFLRIFEGGVSDFSATGGILPLPPQVPTYACTATIYSYEHFIFFLNKKEKKAPFLIYTYGCCCWYRAIQDWSCVCVHMCGALSFWHHRYREVWSKMTPSLLTAVPFCVVITKHDVIFAHPLVASPPSPSAPSLLFCKVDSVAGVLFFHIPQHLFSFFFLLRWNRPSTL